MYRLSGRLIRIIARRKGRLNSILGTGLVGIELALIRSGMFRLNRRLISNSRSKNIRLVERGRSLIAKAISVLSRPLISDSRSIARRKGRLASILGTSLMAIGLIRWLIALCSDEVSIHLEPISLKSLLNYLNIGYKLLHKMPASSLITSADTRPQSLFAFGSNI